jgi:hypothetical protein
MYCSITVFRYNEPQNSQRMRQRIAYWWNCFDMTERQWANSWISLFKDVIKTYFIQSSTCGVTGT